MNIFIGMETSGQTRRAFQARGHHVISCDLLPADDGAGKPNAVECGHMQCDVFEALAWLKSNGWWPDLAIFHPTCTYLTGSAEWAYNDANFIKYPNVGYHQKVKPETLTGEARRNARDAAIAEWRTLMALPIKRKVFENPVGVIGSRVRPATQIIQPYQFGEDASKKTCLWFVGEKGEELPDMRLPLDPALYIPPTLRPNGKSYWANQTDTGQNRLSPGADRWKDRSATYAGISNAFAQHWG